MRRKGSRGFYTTDYAKVSFKDCELIWNPWPGGIEFPCSGEGAAEAKSVSNTTGEL